MATASTKAGTNVSVSSVHAAWPVSMSWMVAPGMTRATASWRAGWMTWSRRLTTTAVGTSISRSQGREWCRPRAAMAWATAHGEVDRSSASAHSSMSRGSRSRARAAAREACTAVRDRATVRSPSIVAPIPVKNARSGSVIWNRSVVAQSTRPPTLSPCWRQTRCATMDPME